jgi:ABC-2 type transport system permease protein
MRSAVLPDAAAVVEISHSWRTLETVAALSVWVILELVVAPVVLRRMTRRESGSRIAERRDKALQRVA